MRKENLQPLVSVIIPVYNAVKYVQRTIESILRQTYTNFELILVVDGSDDGSYEICKEFKKKDNRIKVYYQENKGISAARNKGILMSNGEYILFVDHDDEVKDTMIEVATEAISGTRFFIVKFGIEIYDIDDCDKIKYRVQKYENAIYSNNEIKKNYSKLVKDEIDIYVWDAIYNRRYLLENNLLFDENFKEGGEDTAFNLRLMCEAEQIKLISDVLYIHYNRVKQSTSLNNNETYYRIKNNHILLAEDIFISLLESKYVKEMYRAFVARTMGGVLYRMSSDRNAEHKLILEELNKCINWDLIEKEKLYLEKLNWAWIRIELVRKRRYFILMLIYRCFHFIKNL